MSSAGTNGLGPVCHREVSLKILQNTALSHLNMTFNVMKTVSGQSPVRNVNMKQLKKHSLVSVFDTMNRYNFPTKTHLFGLTHIKVAFQ